MIKVGLCRGLWREGQTADIHSSQQSQAGKQWEVKSEAEQSLLNSLLPVDFIKMKEWTFLVRILVCLQEFISTELSAPPTLTCCGVQCFPICEGVLPYIPIRYLKLQVMWNPIYTLLLPLDTYDNVEFTN